MPATCSGERRVGHNSSLTPSGDDGEDTANPQEHNRGWLGNWRGELVELAGAGECAIPRLQHVVNQRRIGALRSQRKGEVPKALERTEIVSRGALRERRATRGIQRDDTGHGQTVGGGLPKADAVVEHNVRRTGRGQRRNPVLCRIQIRDEVTRQARDIVGRQGGAQCQLGEDRWQRRRYDRAVDLGDQTRRVERHDEDAIGVDSRVTKVHTVDLVDRTGTRRERRHSQQRQGQAEFAPHAKFHLYFTSLQSVRRIRRIPTTLVRL